MTVGTTFPIKTLLIHLEAGLTDDSFTPTEEIDIVYTPLLSNHPNDRKGIRAAPNPLPKF